MFDVANVPPYHDAQFWAGQSLEWMPTDSKAKYDENLRDPLFVAIADEKGWTKNPPITYDMNKQGFRGKDFDSSVKNIVTLGCSFTIGVGLRENETWPYILGEKLALPVHNIAWGGWSCDTLFRMSRYWIPELCPDLVVMLAPSSVRLELITSDTEYFNYSPHDDISNNNYLKHWFANDLNSELNRIKNTMAIEMICKKLNIRFMCYLQDEEMTGRVPHDPTNVARDNMHCGTKTHNMFVEKILKDLHG
jgi:hypothetical protein